MAYYRLALHSIKIDWLSLVFNMSVRSFTKPPILELDC